MSTVGVLGDVCRAVGKAILPYCDELVNIILANLGSPAVHRDIKPELLTVLGDMALAIEGDFAKYLEAVLAILLQAMGMSVQMSQSNGGCLAAGQRGVGAVGEGRAGACQLPSMRWRRCSQGRCRWHRCACVPVSLRPHW